MTDIAAIAPEQRSMAQPQKMALCVSRPGSAENIKQARAKLDSATEARTRYWERCPL